MWIFNKKPKSHGRKEDASSKLFEGLGDVEALIREAFQNAIDAKKKDSCEPVSIKLSLVKVNLDNEPWLIESNFGDFNQHVKQVRKEQEKEHPIDIKGDFISLIIEDFNTRGLCGDFDNDERKKNKGTLVKYWWESNISNKERSAGGSHGLGKETYSLASQSRALFALSTPEDDNENEILIGFARPGRHHLDGSEYLDEVRFGVKAGNNDEVEIHPISKKHKNCSDASLKIDKFKEKFALKRMSKETGTSFAITNVVEDNFSLEKLIEVVCDHFYLPIVSNVINVEIWGLDGSKTYINQGTVEQVVSKNPNEAWRKECSRKILMAQEISEGKIIYQANNFNFDSRDKGLTEDAFSDVDLETMRNLYSQNQPIRVRFFVETKRKDENSKEGCIDIVVQKNNRKDDKKIVGVFRGNINIKEEGRKLGKKIPSDILVNIPSLFNVGGKMKENSLSDFLRFCEDPGHLKWHKTPNRTNEKQLYDRTWQRNLVVGMPTKFLRILENEENQKLENFADEIFSIEVKDTKGGHRGRTNKDDERLSPPILDPIVSVFKIDKINDGDRVGFSIKAQEVLKENFQDIEANQLIIKIRVGYASYAVNKSEALKHSKLEINLKGGFNISVVDADVISTQQNELEFKLKSSDFSFSAEGFDANRDLIVDVHDTQITKQLNKIIANEVA